jgi:hypothetical protein
MEPEMVLCVVRREQMKTEERYRGEQFGGSDERQEPDTAKEPEKCQERAPREEMRERALGMNRETSENVRRAATEISVSLFEVRRAGTEVWHDD